MTVITGVSGSGKTSLAFDTIFAEGQRQYVESLSTYARRFLGRLERAPVDRLDGLQPAIAIDQRASGHNPRSTVATVTEIHDVLRLLYARVGQPHCPQCQRPVRAWGASEAAGHLRSEAVGTGWLTTRLRPAEDGPSRRIGLLGDGWTKLWTSDGEVPLSDEGCLPLLVEGAVLVVDRLQPSRAAQARLAEAVRNAYDLGEGAAVFRPRGGGADLRVTRDVECPDHGVVHRGELTPRHFSFNSRLGACTRCEGVGVSTAIVSTRLLADPTLGIWDALDPRVASVLRRSPRNRALVDALLAHFDASAETPVRDYAPALRAALLDGLDVPLSLKWTKRWGSTKRNVEETRTWVGLIEVLEGWSSRLSWLVAEQECPSCHGGRLRPEIRAVRLGGLGIDALTALPVAAAWEHVSSWDFGGSRAVIAERPLDELQRRLRFLDDVGLGYLALDRSANTLSGGESQRIRLASQLGSSLTGVTYVLDEPTIGLHPRDTERLLGTLEGLRDLGNTVLLVEHDPETIARADLVVDMGPGAGVHGGHVVATGTPTQISANPKSVTGAWLSGRRSVPVPSTRRSPRAWLTLIDPTAHNLRCGTVEVPTGVWVAVSGVSGSGKSTLIMDTLAPALRAAGGAEVFAAAHGGLELGEPVDRVVVIDQRPIGRTPRSTPATYTKVLDALRALFAKTRGAMERGWKPGRFSYNSPAGGRCTVCEGRGATLVEMHFLPDVWVQCDACGGSRFGRETLEVRWKGRSIADILAMRADEALELFTHQRRIRRILQALVDVGLGYLTLGQPATTLSGGEAQRVKLASELTSRRGHALYVLDEPTTGLHLADVERLVQVLHRLVEQGHTVLTIEHHLSMLGQADWMLDLGPEGGAGGGQLVARGTPEAVVASGSATGIALGDILGPSRVAAVP